MLVRDLLPRDSAIFTAASETLRHSGLLADIDDGVLVVTSASGSQLGPYASGRPW